MRSKLRGIEPGAIKVKAIIIGAGGMAQHHLREILRQRRTTQVVGVVEISDASRKRTASTFGQYNMTCPPFYASLRELLNNGHEPDAALIATPHKFHCENVCDCLRAGIDVLVEKPMVLNVREARKVIRLRDKTGRLVVVAFNGSLSPAIHKAKALLAKGLIGRVTGICAHVHQDWKDALIGTWRQNPAISGGGFLFDTGSHMINTVVDLIDAEIEALFVVSDNRGMPGEINSSVSGRFRNGVTFSLIGIGASIHCTSQIRIFGDKGVLETGIWGERLLHLPVKARDYRPIPFRKGRKPWVQFLKVREGKIENPSHPEIGLRFARLMDRIRQST